MDEVAEHSTVGADDDSSAGMVDPPNSVDYATKKLEREPFCHVRSRTEYFGGIGGLGRECGKYEVNRDASGDEPRDVPPVDLHTAVAGAADTGCVRSQSLVFHDDPQYF
jgi:hypothetical protein